MESEPEFPFPTRKEMETITNYLNVESEFIAEDNFYTTDRHILLRKHAVSIIAELWRSIYPPDAFIPYLAMNYFDRFLSRHKMIMKDVQGPTDTAKVRLIAISCLSLSAKMRTAHFSIDQLLVKLYEDMGERRRYLMEIMRMEHIILGELHWKMRSVTAFCFLNYFNPYFKQCRGFKRRCIKKIIVQAQGEVTFVHYLPSHIALSAFLAATEIAYPSKYEEIAEDIDSKIGLQGQVKECVEKMVDFCIRMNIEIETPESGIRSASSKVAAVPEEETKEVGTSEIKETQQSSGNAAIVVDSSEEEKEEEGDPLIRQRRDTGKTKTSHLQGEVEELSDKKYVVAEEIEAERRRLFKGEAVDADKALVEAIIQRAVEKGEEAQAQALMEGHITEYIELAEPKRPINIELNWPIDVPSLEEEIGHAQPHESTTISLKIPGTGTNVFLGCGACNIS